MDPRTETLWRLKDVLELEEAVLSNLVREADRMRDGLIANDLETLQDATSRMDALSEDLGGLEQEREHLVECLGTAPISLNELCSLAETLGITGLSRARQRLAAAAANLQDAQERNARLVLGATRIQERWIRLIAGQAGGNTYGSTGAQHHDPRRGFVSKSA